jgi:antirestriction protein ArdC
MSSDIYQQITDSIIASIEQGVSAWRMPWHAASATPLNAATQRLYRGVNVVGLWAAAAAHCYPSGYWATYRQWASLGAQGCKGEKATLVVFWKFADQETEDEGEDQSGVRRRAFARGYSVFNSAQVYGCTVPQPLETRELERHQNAERFFGNLGADVRHGGNRAYFVPSQDYIQVPHFQAFHDASAYYSTLGHELTHWTGAKNRLNRDLTGRFGDSAYAAEELVAELGAAFLAAALAIDNAPREDHAAYLQTWLSILRKDKRAIFGAASQAQRAVDWMREQQECHAHSEAA